MTATEYVILVDEHDNIIGSAPKLYAHQQALLHRAFSIFVYRKTKNQDETRIEWLLQQRALEKYHSPGLWTNTCCSHPRPFEATDIAATRRLQEEMGLSLPLQQCGRFMYKAEFDNALTEHEIDYVFLGIATEDSAIKANPMEVADFRWVETSLLEKELIEQPLLFTPWFQAAFNIARHAISH